MSVLENLILIAQDEKQSSYRRRQAVVDLLKDHQQSDKTFAVVEKLCESKDNYFIREIVGTLKGIDNPLVLPSLRLALASDDDYVKRDVIQILSKVGTSEDLVALKALCEVKAYSVASAAKQAVDDLATRFEVLEKTEVNEAQVDEPKEVVEDAIEEVQAPVEKASEPLSEPEEQVKPELVKEDISPDLLDEHRESLHDNSIFKDEGVASVHESYEQRSSLEYSDVAPALCGVDQKFDEKKMAAVFQAHYQSAQVLYKQLNECQKQLPLKEKKMSERRRELTLLEADKADDIELSLESTEEESKKTADLKWQIKKTNVDLESLTTENQGFFKNLFNSFSQDRQQDLEDEKKQLEKQLKKLQKELHACEGQLLEEQTVTTQLKQPLITLRQEFVASEADRDDCLKKMVGLEKDINSLYAELIDTQESFDFLQIKSALAKKVILKVITLKFEMTELKGTQSNLEQELKEIEAYSTTSVNELGKSLSTSFRIEKKTIKDEVGISASLNFKEESSFFGGYDNASGSAHGKGKATLRYEISESSWQPASNLSKTVRDFRTNYERLGEASACLELLNIESIRQQMTLDQYIDYLRVLIEGYMSHE
jgi:hypothetical protein